jgi:3-carboxy-cis,cis-muconate cycloisomerase
MSQRLLESLTTTEPLAEVFSDGAFLDAMLRFERALARAEARNGIITSSAADAIARAAAPEAFDPASIARDATRSGTVTIPLVQRLIERVSAIDPAAATYVHWGATSQDVTDTALVLCLQRAHAILVANHERLTMALHRLSEQYASAPMLGRTLMQPAPPTTFGLKAAGWFGAVSRSGEQMASAFKAACVLQFGGASGTLAALGSHGRKVSDDLARELGLPNPEAPWHAHRDRFATLVTSCGIYTGTLGKIARDITLLMQQEVAEAAEPGGGSSTMPHKRNPAGCAIALAAATRVPGLVAAFLAGMPQEHERGVGGHHAEAATTADIVQGTGAALAAVAGAIEGLRVDPARMLHNIAANSEVFAERAMMLLAPVLGRETAKRVIAQALETARRDGRRFVDVLSEDESVTSVIDLAQLSTLDRPDEYLGSAEEFRRRLIGGDRQ